MSNASKKDSLHGVILSRIRGPRQDPRPAEIPPSALAPVPSGINPDGLLKAAVRDDELMITIPFPHGWIDEFPNKDKPDGVCLFVNGAHVGNYFYYDDTSHGHPIDLPLPASARKEGVNTLSYVIWGGQQEADMRVKGEVVPFVVDTEPPGLPFLGRLEFDRDIEENGLTSQKLTELGDALPGKVPSYSGGSAGDIIVPMIDGIPLPSFEVPVAQVGADIILDFLRADLEAAGDGRKRFDYAITDRAGNQSSIAEPTHINTALVGAITDLAPPTVPLNDDDGVINYSDTQTPVSVVIPGNILILEGDAIVVNWGGIKLQAALVGPGHVGLDPLFEVLVPYSTIQSSWKGGTTSVDVTYEVFRGGLRLGEAIAPATVNVNLDTPGGTDPDPTTPIQERLNLLNVQSASGQMNVIPPEDSDKNATAIIPFFNRDNQPTFKLGDEIEIIWNGGIAHNWRPVTSNEISDEDDILLTIPAATVGSASGNVPVSYRVRRQIPNTSAYNVVQSDDQTVEVTAKDTLPGGGDPLPDSEFTARDAKDSILGTQIDEDNGTPLKIPYYINKALGDKISISLQAYWGSSGSGGPAGPPYTASHTVGGDDVSGDWVFQIPKEYFYRLVGQGPAPTARVDAIYTVTNDATGPGGITSDTTDVLIDMRF